MTLLEQLEAATALNNAASKAGVDPRSAQRLIEQLVALPDAGLAILALAKNTQIRAEERAEQRAEIRVLADYRRKANR